MAKESKTKKKVDVFYETVITHLEEEERVMAKKKTAKKKAPRKASAKKTTRKKGKKSAYNVFVGHAMKRGMTMKQAAAAWRAKKGGKASAASAYGYPKPKQSHPGKKRRTPAQKAATRKLVASNKKKATRPSKKKTVKRKRHCGHCGTVVPAHAKGSRACHSCGHPHTMSQHWSHAKGKTFAHDFKVKREGVRPTRAAKVHSMKARLQKLKCAAICKKYGKRKK